MKPIEAQRALRNRIQGRRNEGIDKVAPLDPFHKKGDKTLPKVKGRKFLHIPSIPLYNMGLKYHPEKSGRNAACPCGSQKKFKNCCIRKTV